MKLGEALTHRKYLTGLIPKLTSKLAGCVTLVKDAEIQPSDDKASELKQQLDQALSDIRTIVVRINQTNNATKLPNGMTIMEAIAYREHVKSEHAQYEMFFGHIRPRKQRENPYEKDSLMVEYVVAPGIDPAAVKAQLNKAAQEYRQIDTMLQAANWTVDLIEE